MSNLLLGYKINDINKVISNDIYYTKDDVLHKYKESSCLGSVKYFETEYLKEPTVYENDINIRNVELINSTEERELAWKEGIENGFKIKNLICLTNVYFTHTHYNSYDKTYKEVLEDLKFNILPKDDQALGLDEEKRDFLETFVSYHGSNIGLSFIPTCYFGYDKDRFAYPDKWEVVFNISTFHKRDDWMKMEKENKKFIQTELEKYLLSPNESNSKGLLNRNVLYLIWNIETMSNKELESYLEEEVKFLKEI